MTALISSCETSTSRLGWAGAGGIFAGGVFVGAFVGAGFLGWAGFDPACAAIQVHAHATTSTRNRLMNRSPWSAELGAHAQRFSWPRGRVGTVSNPTRISFTPHRALASPVWHFRAGS